LADSGKAAPAATDTPWGYGKAGWLASGALDEVNGERALLDMVDKVL
jgi:hypothetical protein